jgi:hypothetical protein
LKLRSSRPLIVSQYRLKVSDGVTGLCVACNIVPNVGGVKLKAKDKISLIYMKLGKPYAHHIKGVLYGG